MNSLIIEKTPDMAEALAGCEVGVSKRLTVNITPVADSDTLLVASIDSVEYTEGEAEEKPKKAAKEPAAGGEKPYKKSAPAKMDGMMM